MTAPAKTPNDWTYDLAQPSYREIKARYRARKKAAA